MSDLPSAAPAAAPAATRILDRGYRRYEGQRGGVASAMRSVVVSTVQRALGVHRAFRFKVMPILTIFISYVPHLVYVGVVVLSNRLEERTNSVGFGPAGEPIPRGIVNQLIKDYPSSYFTITAAIALFAAFVAPEVLCTDRRTGMLGLYLASPLSRWSYLGAKLIAVSMILLTVTLGPSLLLLIGYSTQGYGPVGFTDWMLTLGRVILAGVGIGLFYTLISAALASITSRRAAASATFVILVMGTGALVQYLVDEARAPVEWGMVNLLLLPIEFAYRVFGQPTQIYYGGFTTMSTPTVYAAFAGWIVVALAVIGNRYSRVEVTK